MTHWEHLDSFLIKRHIYKRVHWLLSLLVWTFLQMVWHYNQMQKKVI